MYNLLKYMLEWSITNNRNSEFQECTECRKSLKPSDCESYRDELLLRRHENTCLWVLDDLRYRSWVKHDGQAILWIIGIPGCGKSILSSFLTKQIILSKADQLFMAYFFCDDKDERLRTAQAILVNLLSQLLQQVPDFIKHFLAEHEFATKKENTTWTIGMLWRIFERIMNDTNARQGYILIDALGIYA